LGKHRASFDPFDELRTSRAWSIGQKLGTKKRESESRIQNEKSKSKYLFSTDYWLLTTEFSVFFPDT